ncbi:hypothetical protein [Pyrobaculum aerophilum]|uniref:Uncharacterized protein n=1 Tax=Pyrobaculum aerophilum TaxID=13773 RepID=A0A371QZE9_9CREN|nr:hypothetical protein [Pyrobaculum aerophilum]RFA92334.1 hypothetical protein CGL51_14625 [Pyrobaculum aerophilum]RFA96201.1 hypothetical protein CGL52_11275 [Pyrobaculum aerophilum]
MAGRYELVASTELGGVKLYLWKRGDYLYLRVLGPVKKTVYLGKAVEINVEEAGPCKECWELLKEIAEDYHEAVQIAKKALREGQTKDDYREALSIISYAPKALRQALKMVGHAEE